MGREIYGARGLADGFRNPALVRFTSGEEPYLSPSHGGPRMWCDGWHASAGACLSGWWWGWVVVDELLLLAPKSAHPILPGACRINFENWLALFFPVLRLASARLL